MHSKNLFSVAIMAIAPRMQNLLCNYNQQQVFSIIYI